MRFLTLVLAAQIAATGGALFTIERLDPALDELIAPDTPIETLGDRFALTEGALWVPDSSIGGIEGGYLAFGDTDDRGLYITACTHVFKLRMKTPGVRPGQRRS